MKYKVDEGHSNSVLSALPSRPMPISFDHKLEGELLKITTQGSDDSLEDVYRYGMAILGLAIEHQCKLVLCDERNLAYKLSTMDTYELAEIASREAKFVQKIAVICNEKYLQNARFYETVAQNRGLTIRVTSEEEDALNWLRN